MAGHSNRRWPVSDAVVIAATIGARLLSGSPEAPRSVVWLFGTALLVVALLWTDRQRTRLEGAALVVLAGIRWVINLV